jgi:hypothetical protein
MRNYTGVSDGYGDNENPSDYEHCDFKIRTIRLTSKHKLVPWFTPLFFKINTPLFALSLFVTLYAVILHDNAVLGECSHDPERNITNGHGLAATAITRFATVLNDDSYALLNFPSPLSSYYMPIAK